MKTALWLLALVALAAADPWQEPWVEEEDLEEPYSEEREEEHHDADPPRPRARREVYEDVPYEEYVRVKRHCCDDVPYRVRRGVNYIRIPRQVHQYEVHEFTDDGSLPSPPYEEMLAASAEHYHRAYIAPGAPSAARYLHPDVSAGPFGVRPVPSITRYTPSDQQGPTLSMSFAESPQKLVSQQQTYVNHTPNQPQQQTYVNYTPNQPQHFQPIHTQVHPAKLHAPVNIAINHSPRDVVSHVSGSPSDVTQGAVQFVAANVSPVAGADGRIPVVGPAIASEPVAPVVGFADGDLLSSAAGHQHHQHRSKHHGHSAGGGHKQHAGHHATKGGKSVKGFKEHHHSDKGAKGHKLDEHHRKEYEEAAGKKKKHHDHAHHKGGHEEEAHGHRGAHFDEKKGHKKGHKTKGYHNKYHKDEFHKEHKFYDDFHKSGEHHRYGKFHAKHASDESGKKKAHHVNAGHDFVERGKKGYSNKGHMDNDHKGYKGKHGHEEHHEHHKEHGKKGGNEGGKEWGYEKKN